MLEIAQGDLLKADVEAVVNTVNTVGIMGKGIALQFKQAYPDNYDAYRMACQRGAVQPGEMFVFSRESLINPRYIINFPTKRHWRGKARMEDIEQGLQALLAVVKEKHIHSLALPPLGCGNGGLNWNEVKPRIEAAFAALPEVRVLLYPPAGPPAPEQMRVGTSAPKMTPGRAALIGLLGVYMEPGYRLSMLEVQKLAYFLQVAGEPLRLHFVKEQYGPYAEAVHHVLQRMEGHFIRGYGDRSKAVSVRLLPNAQAAADEYLEQHPETKQRLARVAQLIDGFETPYSLELLATVHWLAQENPAISNDPQAAVDGVHAWSQRKHDTFRAEHIVTAWERLREQEWI